MRAVHDATAGELRRAGRALTGAAGALLPVRLLAAAADLAAGLRGVRALAGGGELGHDDLVDQRHVGLDVEDLGGQLDRAVGLAGRRTDVNGRHEVRLPSACSRLTAPRTRTVPPLGPGTAPLMSSRPRSASIAWTVRFWVVWRDAAHPAGHPQALEDAARGGAAADRAGLAVVAVRAVGGADAVEAVPLHDTGEALALGRADDVDVLAGLEQLDRDLLAELVARRRRGADLDQVAARGDAGLLEVAGHRLVDLARVDRAVRDLDGVVAVGLAGADLGDDARAGLDHRDRNEPAVVVPDLGHAELLAEHRRVLPLESCGHLSSLRA